MGLYSATASSYGLRFIDRVAGMHCVRVKRAGDRSGLGAAQLKWIYNTVTTRNPRSRGLLALWTRAKIRALIRRASTASNSARYRWAAYWHKWGWTCQKPLSRAFEQDASLIKRWMEREFPKLRALAKKERAVIFFSDESGVRSDFHAGTTWGIRGKTPVAAHTGKRFHLNMLSASLAKGELRFMTSRKRISAGLFIDFLGGD